MGHWGLDPWENDAAADWLQAFAERTQLSERIEEGLALPADRIEEIRAACYLLLKFSEAGVWLVDQPARLTTLAVDQLSEAIESGVCSNPEFRNAVVAEREELRSHLSTEEADPG